jgi:WD repeat-containing protein 23
MTASQDNHLRLYDTATWAMTKDYSCNDVGWSILSVDYSPDEQWILYSTWSENVHLFSATGESDRTECLDVCGDYHAGGRVCLFSTQFSPDSTEILAGSSDNHVYVFNLERNEREMRIDAHADDVNAVAWADDSRSVFFSASDDATIKVWDRRCPTSDGAFAGVLLGHSEGVTYLDSLGDGVHLLSNGKDQRAKLWDIRRMAAGDVHGHGVRSNFDYRYGRGMRGGDGFGGRNIRHRHDSSVMTYEGAHQTYRTLLRAKVSPLSTTDQRYVAVASHDGSVAIYNLLTGGVHATMRGHEVLVRDVSWHPYRPELVSTSWDGSCQLWSCTQSDNVPLARRAKEREFARYGYSVGGREGR